MKNYSKLLGLILILMLMMCSSFSVFAKETDTVTVSVMGYDKAIVNSIEVPMDIFDVTKYAKGAAPDKFTALHGIIYALKNGSNLDLNNAKDFTCKDSYISTVAGISEFDCGAESGWMYTVNNVKPSKSISEYPLKKGDIVTLYYSGGMSSHFAYFSPNVKTAVIGGDVQLQLLGNSGNLGESQIGSLANIAIEINGKETEHKTDAAGYITLSFDKVGEYFIGAKNFTTDKKGNTTVHMNYAVAKVIVKEPVKGPDADLKSLIVEAYDKENTKFTKEITPIFNANIVKYKAAMSTAQSSKAVFFRYDTVNPNAKVNFYCRLAGTAQEKKLDITKDFPLVQNEFLFGVNYIRIEVIAPESSFVPDKNYYIDLNVEPGYDGFTTTIIAPNGDTLLSNSCTIGKYSELKPYPGYIHSNNSAVGLTYDDSDLKDGALAYTPIYAVLNSLMYSSGSTYTFSDLHLKALNGTANGDAGQWQYAIDGIVQTLPMGSVNSNLKKGCDLTVFWLPAGSTSCFLSMSKFTEQNQETIITLYDGKGKPVKDASILVDKTEKGKTDAKGEVKLSFAQKGIFNISAKKISNGKDTLVCSSKPIKIGNEFDILSLEFKTDSGKITKELTPQFNVDTHEYSIEVDWQTKMGLSVKPILANDKSMVYNYFTDGSGAPCYNQLIPNVFEGMLPGANQGAANYLSTFDGDKNVGYNVGENSIRIVVFSEDLKIKEYKINLTRNKSNNPNLTALRSNEYFEIADANGKPFRRNNPSRAYFGTVSYDVENVKLITKSDDAIVKIIGDGKLNVGDNLITINTISQDRKKTQKYTLTITRTPELDYTKISINPGYIDKSSQIGNKSQIILCVPYETENFDLILDAPENSIINFAPLGSWEYDATSGENYMPGETITLPFLKNQDVLNLKTYIVKTINGKEIITPRDITINKLGDKNLVPSSLFGYAPAPGQFTNSGYCDPSCIFSKEINKDNLTNILSLGAFGGSAIYYYDKPITNSDNHRYGIDFIVYGNSFGKSGMEPGAIKVAQDNNKDGKPDTDNKGKELWYDLAGSMHYADETIWNYKVTYYNKALHGENNGNTAWSDNLGGFGTLDTDGRAEFPSNDAAKQWDWKVDFPKDKFTTSGVHISGADLDFGYFDVHPHTKCTGEYADCVKSDGFDTPLNPYTSLPIEWNKSKGDGMDISWAVDANGNPVFLDEISFVKSYTANLSSGGTGELSSELGGIIRTKTIDSVGKTDAINTITITPVTKDEVEPINVALTPNKNIYDIYSAPKSFTVNIGSDADNIYINGKRLVDTKVSHELTLKNGKSRFAQVLVQSGDKEANIYLLRFHEGGEDTSSVDAVIGYIKALPDVSSITLTDKDKVVIARNGYNALNVEQKANISLDILKLLTDAEA
ncbi:MAG: DUF4430 domain-containing protein, partial [Clostridiales bacterium]